MTKEQAILNITRTAQKYGFEMTNNPMGGDIPAIRQTSTSYAGFTILADEIAHDFENRRVERCIRVQARVCQMNPNADAAELVRASQEIMNAAQVVMELDKLDLSWIEKY